MNQRGVNQPAGFASQTNSKGVSNYSNNSSNQMGSMNQKSQEPMEEAIVKKVSISSFADVFGMINMFIGLVIGLILTILSFVSPSITSAMGSYGYFSILIFPVIYGILGYIGGALFALFYNLSAKLVKGVKLYS